MRALRYSFLILSAWCLLSPATAAAQSATTGAIAGVARDSTGAVLPGVTVEASSPALIEKVRSAVADGQGNYKIIDLRPGTYSVTFTLSGFSAYKREGVELTTGMTANVNGELRVGSLEETVTVTGASPVVDIQNVRSQTVLSREVLDALPTNRALQGYAALTLGATLSNASNHDVGGNQGEAGGFGYFSVHGGRANDQRMTLEGMHFYALIGSGAAGNRTNYINQMAVAETTIQTSGYGAEAETGGVQINIVPKDGGNSFSGSGLINGTSGKLQSNNLDDDLRARGIATPPNVKSIYDQGVGFGGPIAQDKLWFYTGHRRWGSQNTVPGMYFNATPGTLVHTPDLSRPAYTWIHNRDHQGRITWQVTSKQKLTGSQGFQWDANEYYEVERGRAPEGSTWLQWSPNSMTQTTWNYPRTNRLLFEAGQLFLWEDQTNSLLKNGAAGTLDENNRITPNFISINEVGGTFPNIYNSRSNGLGQVDPGKGSRVHVATQRASVSYVTGSHAMKVGMTTLYSPAKSAAQLPNVIGYGPIRYQYRNGLPFQITQWLSPNDRRNRTFVFGTFVQDQWTMQRVTLNLGARYDRHAGWVPPETLVGVPEFGIPSQSFNEVKNVPLWQTIRPRLGAAYDLFGNGRTAIKGSLGQYNETESNGIASNNNPLNAMGTSTNRSWNDANGNRLPECNLASPAANGECGPWQDPTFGQGRPGTTYDPDLLVGWNDRPYSWQGSLTLQHQLVGNVGLSAGYFRTWYGQQRITVNRTVATVGVDEYCTTTPTDPVLGDYSARRICGLYDAKRIAAPDNFITHRDNLGEATEVFDGLDIGMQARFGKGGLVSGGVSTGRTVSDSCALVQGNLSLPLTVAGGSASRTNTDFCRTVQNWGSQTQYKAAVNYPLPLGVNVAGTLQNLPGIPINPLMQITGAQTTLGRALTTGTATILAAVPYTNFENRMTQVDLRFSKSLRLARFRAQGQVDLYNAFNANTVLAINQSLGAAFRRPIAVLGARLLKFGVQMDF
jgi:hypothetical protein